ncbi:MAG: hypothetical protein II119_02290 [Bacilli bacterium]|nr:hypothetical protein [Bacilli bacterium]
MRGKRKSLGLLVYVLIAVVALGIGYAAISAITLTINGTAHATPSQDNFIVEFDTTATNTITSSPANIASYNSGSDVTAASIDTANDATKRTAKFDLYGFTTRDEYADVTFTVVNKSPDIKAKLCSSDIAVSGGSSASFTSTASLPSATGNPACVTLNANGGTTTIVVHTVLNVTPSTADISATDLIVQFTATPVANS